MIAVGIALVALGVAGLLGKQVQITAPSFRFRSGTAPSRWWVSELRTLSAHPSARCPLFLDGIDGIFKRMGMFAGMANFVAYAMGMGMGMEPFVTGLSLFAS